MKRCAQCHRKAGIRCTLPYFVEWALVGSRLLLFDPLRNSLRAGAGQRTSLAHPARSPQFAELTLDCHVGVAAFMMRRRVAVCECIVIRQVARPLLTCRRLKKLLQKRARASGSARNRRSGLVFGKCCRIAEGWALGGS